MTDVGITPLVRHPVRNAWFATRIPISRSTLLARFLSWRARGDRGGRLTRGVQACIDGFQRSGNTLAVYACWRGNPELRLAHHFHAAAEVERAVRRSIPTVVLIRQPADAISSLIMYQGREMHPRLGIESYIAYYRHTLPFRSGFAVCMFDQLVADPGTPVHLLNERFEGDLLEVPFDDDAITELRTAIEHTQRRRGDPARKWSAPIDERRTARPAIVAAVQRDPRFRIAAELYEAFAALS